MKFTILKYPATDEQEAEKTWAKCSKNNIIDAVKLFSKNGAVLVYHHVKVTRSRSNLFPPGAKNIEDVSDAELRNLDKPDAQGKYRILFMDNTTCRGEDTRSVNVPMTLLQASQFPNERTKEQCAGRVQRMGDPGVRYVLP